MAITTSHLGYVCPTTTDREAALDKP
jgi:hypothetical protein